MVIIMGLNASREDGQSGLVDESSLPDTGNSGVLVGFALCSISGAIVGCVVTLLLHYVFGSSCN